MGKRAFRALAAVAVLALVAGAGATSAVAAGGAHAGSHGPRAGAFRASIMNRVSGVVQPQAIGRPWAAAPGTTICSSPGGGNYRTDCNSTGQPVNETTVATNGSLFVAGANDYNSYNGNAQFGYYWSSDGKTWNDAGPLDLFPHAVNNGAGDPGLAVDASGVVYYSGIFFSYTDFTVGGVELARYNPGTGGWAYYQIAPNTAAEFQDKPAVAIDDTQVAVAWTNFNATGSPIDVAIFPNGPDPSPPTVITTPPGSSQSQGASIASDGSGGWWVSWEEFLHADKMKLAHYAGGVWTSVQTISPPTFVDLPSPLPGFSFRNDSFPSLAIANGYPYAVWTSYDEGVGRVNLWSNGSLSVVSDKGGDQFFPSIAALTGPASTGYVISWSQVGRASGYNQYLRTFNGVVSRISTRASYPNDDCFFGGAFIGDYNSTAANGSTALPIWTDVRRSTPSCTGRAQDAMVYVP